MTPKKRPVIPTRIRETAHAVFGPKQKKILLAFGEQLVLSL